MSRYKVPHDSREWTDEEHQQLWTMFMDGKGPKQIAEALGRTDNEVMCKKFKTMTEYCQNKEGKPKYCPSGPDRKGKLWRKRDQHIMRVAKRHRLPVKRIARMLGRSVDEVERQINPRYGKATFLMEG